MRSMLPRLSAITIATLSAAVIASAGPANAADSSTDQIQQTLGRSGITAACPTDQNVRWTRLFSNFQIFTSAPL